MTTLYEAYRRSSHVRRGPAERRASGPKGCRGRPSAPAMHGFHRLPCTSDGVEALHGAEELAAVVAAADVEVALDHRGGGLAPAGGHRREPVPPVGGGLEA